jgi:hypothetical protein
MSALGLPAQAKRGRPTESEVVCLRPNPGGRIGGRLLLPIALTVPLTTLTNTAASLDAGPRARAWIMNAMSVGAVAEGSSGVWPHGTLSKSTDCRV